MDGRSLVGSPLAMVALRAGINHDLSDKSSNKSKTRLAKHLGEIMNEENSGKSRNALDEDLKKREESPKKEAWMKTKGQSTMISDRFNE
jgi:hypothetical protein